MRESERKREGESKTEGREWKEVVGCRRDGKKGREEEECRKEVNKGRVEEECGKEQKTGRRGRLKEGKRVVGGSRKEKEGRRKGGREGVFAIFNFNDFSIQPTYKFTLFINHSLTLICRASSHGSQVAIPVTHAALEIGSR